MKVCVMGAGAVGSYFGAKLARAGHDVTLVARGAHLRAMACEGLRVKSIEGNFVVSPQITDDPSTVGPCDLVLFCVKGPDTESAARLVAAACGPQTVILPLQNGVENEGRLAAVLGPERIVGGMCYVGARVDVPGEVIHSAAGRITAGELDGSDSERLRRIASAFAEAGVPFLLTADVRAEKWKKLLWNLSFNPVSALTRATVGRLLGLPHTRTLLLETMREAVAVAAALGIALEADLPERTLASSASFPELKTSMLQDVEKGRPLEVEEICGVVGRLGRTVGVPTPVNDVVYALLRSLDESLRLR